MWVFSAGGNHHDNKLSSETSSPDAELTLRDELSSSVASSLKTVTTSLKKTFKTRKEGVMSKSMQVKF
jgi:hypothetical protein